jgi:hypothetical protein
MKLKLHATTYNPILKTVELILTRLRKLGTAAPVALKAFDRVFQ